MHPRTGHWIREDSDYPDHLRAAGARSIAVVGLPHHPDSQSPAFAFGSIVRLVPDPHNAVDHNAIGVRSADGRQLAGYVPADVLDSIRAVEPPPTLGLIVWENYTYRPRRRMGIRIVVGPSIEVQMVPQEQEHIEQERRTSRYEAARRQDEIRHQAERLEREAERFAAREAKAREREAATEGRRQAASTQASLEAARRTGGLCVSCGGPIEPHLGRGRPPIRCAKCQAALSLRRGT